MMGNHDFLLDSFRNHAKESALVHDGHVSTYEMLLDRVQADMAWLESLGVGLGVPVVVLGDLSLRGISLFLALIQLRAISIPLTRTTYQSLGAQLDEAAPQLIVDATGDEIVVERRAVVVPNDLYKILIDRKASGLVLFTSGSTGRPKAVVHDFTQLLRKFQNPRPGLITLNFMLFDHWGGLNTLLGGLASATLVVFPQSRTPHDVCRLIAQYRIELLPTTPSFLNMLLISGAYAQHDMSSLRLITYGAEPMPESTLQHLRRALPAIELRQTYGMIELGVLRAKSKSSDSLWVKIGGEGYQLRVVDNMLQIKAESAMLGYLNAPSPFTEDGYLMTGDAVEQEGEYLRILGRKSDIINVGGQKVYPAEIESVLLEILEIADAVVYGEKHVLMGSIVCADLRIEGVFDQAAMRQKVKQYCAAKLQPYMVPVRINFPTDSLYTDRGKRRRDR